MLMLKKTNKKPTRLHLLLASHKYSKPRVRVSTAPGGMLVQMMSVIVKFHKQLQSAGMLVMIGLL